MPMIDWTDPNRPAPKLPQRPPLGRDAELVRRVRQTIADFRQIEAERGDVGEGDWLLTADRVRHYRLGLARELRAYRLARRRLVELLDREEDFVNHLASGNL